MKLLKIHWKKCSYIYQNCSQSLKTKISNQSQSFVAGKEAKRVANLFADLLIEKVFYIKDELVR